MGNGSLTPHDGGCEVMQPYRLPSHSSKTVLSTMHVGGPKLTVGRTIFELLIAL